MNNPSIGWQWIWVRLIFSTTVSQPSRHLWISLLWLYENPSLGISHLNGSTPEKVCVMCDMSHIWNYMSSSHQYMSWVWMGLLSLKCYPMGPCVYDPSFPTLWCTTWSWWTSMTYGVLVLLPVYQVYTQPTVYHSCSSGPTPNLTTDSESSWKTDYPTYMVRPRSSYSVDWN